MSFSPQQMIKLYRNMERGRRFNEVIVELCRMVELPQMWSSGVGMEAVEAGAASFLMREDWVWSTQRSITACLAKGLDPKIWLRNNLMRVPNHPLRNNPRAFSAPSAEKSSGFGNNPSSQAENLTKHREQGENGAGRVILYLFGDSSVRPDEIIQWIEQSCKGKLPIIWVYIQKPGSSLFTSDDIGSCISQRVSSNGHGMLEMSVNGRDAVAVARTVLNAVDRARKGIGPSLITANLIHANQFPNRSIVNHMSFEIHENHDPVRRLRERLQNRHLITVQELRDLETKIAAEVSQVFDWAVKTFVN
jgi:TPP-dependent pyruvate/acetoin dehydrogenase alpha subunit